VQYSPSSQDRYIGGVALSKRAEQEACIKAVSLVKALAHPHRVHALHILNQRVASPKELAAEVESGVSQMSYHIGILEKGGFVELVSEERRRGATEHYYRGTKRAIFYDHEWVLVPEPIRSAIVGMELKETGRLLSASLGSGTFEKRGNRHHSLHTMLVDKQGWNDAMVALRDAMDRLSDIQTEVTNRAASGESTGSSIPLAVSLIGFERAPEG
jgi:DNA-binding transcriptional ArsR family regulator